MKKIILVTLLVAVATALPNLGKTQAPDTSTIEKLQRYVAGPLDKSQVPTGFLEDYGAPFIPMAAFNGNLSDSNMVEINLWRLLYFQLQTSYCQTGTNPLPSIVTVNESLKNAGTAAIPISILLGQYAKVKDNAYTNNLVYFNSGDNRVYDVAARTQSPYNTNYLFAAAPLHANNVTNTASFVYNPSLVWANTGLTISQLQINFDDGQGLRTLLPNTPVNINYTDTGYHTLTIKATLSNNAVLQCYSRYYVLTVSNNGPQPLYAAQDIVSPLWGAIDPVPGVHGGGTISYILSNNNTTDFIKKPLIVAENMDVFGIAPKLQNRPYMINDLLASLNNSFLEGYDFNNALDVAQYDLVFVNFTKGEDGVVNNAQVFKEAISKINFHKSGSQQNVVLGIGTGGIVARYALAEVTKQSGGNPTQTRLLITHDAPHRGANIALGIQMMTRMLASYNYFGITARQIFPEYDETMKYYDAPINQDILLYRSTSDQNFNANTFINAVYQPMVNYISPYRFVATSLGNECANQLMPAGSKFIDMGMEVYAKLKGKVLWGLVGITLLKVNYETLIYARAVPTASDGNRKIASVKCVFALKLFGAMNIAKTGYDKTVSAGTSIIPYDGVPGSTQQTLGFNSLREYYNALEFLSGASTVLNTANAVYEYIQAIKKAIKAIKAATTLLDVLQSPTFFGISLQPGFTAETQSFYTAYTYLPVGSALDVDPFNINTFNQKYVNGVNQNYPSKSNTFIAQETLQSQSLFNNASMRFTARNARFMYNEMESLANTENCSAECSNPYFIEGSNILCTSNSYFIPGLPRGATVTWLPTPSGIVTPFVNGNQLTLTKLTDGVITLTATISNACGGPIVIQGPNITVGTPTFTIGGVDAFNLYGSMFDYSPNGPGNSLSVCPNEWLIFTPYFPIIFNQSLISTHEWTVSGVSTTQLNNPSLSVVAPFAHPATFSFTYRYQNACGFSAYSNGIASTRDCAGGEEPFRGTEKLMAITTDIVTTLSIFPNPVHSNLFINIPSDSMDIVNTKITITDISGRTVKQMNTVSQTNTIPVGAWANGTYIVIITDGNRKMVKKIVKN